MKKWLAIALCAIMALTLAACSGAPGKPAATQTPLPESTPSPSPAGIVGKTVDWGKYEVLVPDGFELAEAGEFSSYDFAVKKSTFYYFDFNTEAADDRIMASYDYNKETYTNEQTDVEATCGANKWTGFQYSDGWGGYAFEAYAVIGGKTVRVSSAGYRFDSPEAQAVLASLTAK